MTYILQILNIPDPKDVQDAVRLVDQEDQLDKRVDTTAGKMQRFAKAALRYYPNATEKDEEGKHTIWPEGLDPQRSDTTVWNVALGFAGLKNKVLLNLANLAAQEQLQILDPQAGILYRADGRGMNMQGTRGWLRLFEAPNKPLPAPSDVLTACEAEWFFAQSAQKRLKELGLKPCLNGRMRIYWQRRKNLSWGIEPRIYQIEDRTYLKMFLHFEFPELAKRVFHKVKNEACGDNDTVGEQINRMRRSLDKNYSDFSMQLTNLWELDHEHEIVDNCIRPPTYENICTGSEKFWQWFIKELLPRLQCLDGGVSIRELIDTKGLLQYCKRGGPTPRNKRFLLALMTEYNSPNLTDWRELLAHAWWDDQNTQGSVT